MLQKLLLLALWCGQSAFAQSALTLHVAPGGDDNWTGRQARATASGGDGPMRTLAAAQRAARAALASGDGGGAGGGTGGGVRVLIQPGRYVLSEPLVFGPADSGRAGQPTVYQASEPGKAVLSGGRPLVAQSAATSQKVAVFDAPPVEGAFWAGGPQLYVNGQRAVLAREPNEGTDWFVGQPVPVPGEPPNALGQEAFRTAAPALAFLQRLTAEDRARALVHVMQSWSSGRHRLAPGAPNDAVRLSPRSRWPYLNFGTAQRYHVENVAAALDQAGEWSGSPAGVRYLLRPGDKLPVDAVLPLLEHLLVVRGAGPAGPYVQHLEFRDLAFEHTVALTPPAGWVDTQAAVDVGAAIEVDFARNVVVQGCRISATGGYGVWLREGVRDSLVADCNLHDLGAGGVKIGQPPSPQGGQSNAARSTGANRVTGNRIQTTGRQYPGAVALWVGASFDNELSHNTISDTRYSAISVGWQWGYGGVSSGRNRIVANALQNIGNGMLADVGGIYTLGPSPGTVIADNLIREVRGYPEYGAGAWGIYNDEGSSDVQVSNNVVIGTDSGAYHLHYGRNIVVSDNLFALGDAAEVLVTRSDLGRTRLALRNNLLITGSTQPLAGFAKAPDTEYSGNTVAPARPGQAPALQACAAGCAPSDAVLTQGPAPQQLRLTGIDAARARRWVDTAANAGVPSSTVASGAAVSAMATIGNEANRQGMVTSPRQRPPALQLSMDLAAVPDHGRPPGWRYVPAMPREAIEVTADSNAPGQRCLQLNDSDAFVNAYEPYVWAMLNHQRGTSTASFAVRVDEQADLLHEWRDDASPYRTGPSLRITRLGVEVAGRIVAPVRPGSWLQVKVTSPVAGSGPWQLQVIDSDGKAYTTSGLTPKSPGWQGLRWLGFIANGKVVSATCLATVKVTNDAP